MPTALLGGRLAMLAKAWRPGVRAPIEEDSEAVAAHAFHRLAEFGVIEN
jgi:hypothetical protein